MRVDRCHCLPSKLQLIPLFVFPCMFVVFPLAPSLYLLATRRCVAQVPLISSSVCIYILKKIIARHCYFFSYSKEYFQDGSRIEAAFRKYIHRADVKQANDSHELIVCHANVIRYFVCR